ncbi:heme o synthase [Caldilinea sp.]|uniref:heme o synthase n=1 Tax=Caldilinea sp. TaxID=2293560 RepID=UPI002B5E8871|nr:heme o synthase [Caldilinea sp.]HRA66821.1 heme o synthase [Caldilinea sp.]
MIKSTSVKEQGQEDSELTRDQALVRLAISDYVMLTKPRIVLLLLIVTFVPMFLAGPSAPSGWLILWTMIGGFLAAGGANALNQYVDRDIDHVMVRTRRRPLPGGRMSPTQVLIFGIILGALSFVVLWWQVNLLSALVALFGLLFYAVVYTLLLKRSSTQNIVIGGLAGAVPPLVGWTAVANEISLLPVIMVLIVFYWTPPHFWALALMRQKEYRAAGVPMLPVIAGERETHRQILLYSVLLLLISVLPVFLQLLGPVYLVLALLLNGIFLGEAVAIWRTPSNANIWRLYKYSLLFLALIFLAMGIDGLFYTAPAGAVNFTLRLPW